MPLASSGDMSIGGAVATRSINLELGRAATATTNLNEAPVRNLGQKASGAISIWDFYGKSVGFTFNQTISANTTDYNLKAAAIAAGWNQTDALFATVTINAGVYVYASSTSVYAFDTGSTFPTGSTLALINNGGIIGKGGTGGRGGQATADNAGQAGFDGSAGGPALIARYAISITNNGTIGGGGGGGGGSGPTLDAM